MVDEIIEMCAKASIVFRKFLEKSNLPHFQSVGGAYPSNTPHVVPPLVFSMYFLCMHVGSPGQKTFESFPFPNHLKLYYQANISLY